MSFLLVTVLLVTLHVGFNSVKATPEDGGVLFDPNDLIEYDMPASCAGQTYCFDKGENYPDEKVALLLEDMREMVDKTPESQISFASRNGDTYDEPDCPSNSTENPIYYITDMNGNVRVVVQSPKKFLQIYSVKWCLNEGRITSDTPHFLKTTTTKFNIECTTTRMNFDFFVLSEGMDLKMEVAKPKGGIPVCCRCRYEAQED